MTKRRSAHLSPTILPSANGAMTDARTCLYTMTPDEDFIVDRLPGAENIIVASPCSGHGFKFAPVIGEILAGSRLEGATPHDISRFRSTDLDNPCCSAHIFGMDKPARRPNAADLLPNGRRP